MYESITDSFRLKQFRIPKKMTNSRNTVFTKGHKTFEKIVFNMFERRHKPLENEACFMFLLDGEFQIRTPLKTVLLSEKDGVLSKCGSYIYETTNPSERIEVIGVYFHPEIVKQLLGESIILWTKKNYNAHLVQLTELYEAYKSSIIYYMEHPMLFTEEMQLLKIKELLLILAQTESAPSIHHFISSLFIPTNYEFKEIIEKNIYAPLSVQQLADLSGHSLSSFKQRFTNTYNDSPAAYLKKRKLQKAVRMLQLKNLRISEIAYACGFESVATFNRLFKNRYQLSPTLYKTKMSNK